MENQNLAYYYEIYLKNAEKAKAIGDFNSAKHNYAKAAEMLLKLAEGTSGSLQQARVEKADYLLDLAKKMDLLNRNEPINVVNSNKQVNSGTNTKNNEAKNNNEEKEEVYEESSIPSISFEDVAGLEDVKTVVKNQVLLPLQYPDIYKAFKRDAGGGILMYGLPGTGKTMIAKAIAHECDAHFFEVKSSNIIGKWLGEGEKKIKSLFETARSKEKAVIFFDEFEALAQKRDEDTHDAVKRIVAELLAQMDGVVDKDGCVLLVIAATNVPWEIDDGLMRPGRFGNVIPIELPDEEAREYIIRRNLKDLPTDDDLDYKLMIETTKGANGADIKKLVDDLKDPALKRSIENNGQLSNISNLDVMMVCDKFKSSVSPEAKKKFEDFKASRNAK